ncbi:hypothetical protein LSTR_LSTR011369 [Laodelphax striatellus]|uniref:FAM91 C-terminal domain-containing protein n=1 Tax=Laodelphax striatellus TaxID=195883 RepID=A0A482WV25_LAOST|nr:hypothetical protein LSTR_LSTR011369 [Laodelphax striatellus]
MASIYSYVSSTRDDSEGEVRRYFEHALILRSTVMRLRHVNAGLDLVRCESLQSLDNDTCARLLEKNYGLLDNGPVEQRGATHSNPPAPPPGPPTQDVNSIWFKLYLYHITAVVRHLFSSLEVHEFENCESIEVCERVLVTLWGHDPTVIPLANLVFALNDALFHSPVLVQAYGSSKGADIHMLPFPFINDSKDNTKWCSHPAVDKVSRLLDLKTHVRLPDNGATKKDSAPG